MLETTPTKDDLLAALATERRFWDALVAVVDDAGLMDCSGIINRSQVDDPGTTDESWTFKDLAAHLNGWRAQTVARLQAAHRGVEPPAPPWPAGLDEDTPAEVDAINAWFYERSRERPTAEVLAETTVQFDALVATVTTMPADDLLTPGRFRSLVGDLAIGPALGYSFVHLHTDHEPNIRAWLRRELGNEPTLPPAPPTFGCEDED
jgi:hypothetical protein